MTMLGQANPYFVRCIKPNIEKRPNQFQPQIVLNQLKYSGKLISASSGSMKSLMLCASNLFVHNLLLMCPNAYQKRTVYMYVFCEDDSTLSYNVHVHWGADIQFSCLSLTCTCIEKLSSILMFPKVYGMEAI